MSKSSIRPPFVGRLQGGPFDGMLYRCSSKTTLVYRLDPHHDLYHVYQRDAGANTLRHTAVIDVVEYRRRWKDPSPPAAAPRRPPS